MSVLERLLLQETVDSFDPRSAAVLRQFRNESNAGAESLIASGCFQPPTLKQPQRPQDEGQDAAKAIRIDLGDG